MPMTSTLSILPPPEPASLRAVLSGERARSPEISVVVPVRDEADGLGVLIDEIVAALEPGPPFEIVIVDDGSRDGTAMLVEARARGERRLRLVRHREGCGQSAAIRSGVVAARGALIVTLDGDGQNDPADIPMIVARFRQVPRRHLGLVAGMRRRRNDPWIKRVSSRIANRVRAWLLGDGNPDTGCGLKAITRSVYLGLPYFDHQHRFLPALVRREGLTVVSVPVNHRPRRGGRSHYGTWDRLLAGIVDLAGVCWLLHRRRLPEMIEPP